MEKEEVTLAYMAGIMDGDGCFFISKENGKSRQEKGFSECYTPVISLANSDLELVTQFKQKFTGSVSKMHSQLCRGKFTYQWRIDRSKKCSDFLDKVKKYLIIKKDRAEYLLLFIKNHIKYVVSPNRTSEKELKERYNHYARMKQYNSDRVIVPNFTDRLVPLQESNDEFWAYVAGIWDSDGAFSLSRSLPPNRNTFSYVHCLVLTQIDHRAIEFIHGGCQLGLRYFNMAPATKGKFVYRYEIKSKKKIKLFISKCLPFLKQKKKRAQLLLDFLNVETGYRFTDEQLTLRENIYMQLKALNMGSINPT